jgi:hypothetical protein
MFVPYSRNTVIRAYFDKYVDKARGATIEEVAAALGYATKNISDAVFQRPGATLVEYKKMGGARHHSTDEHLAGWDAVLADQVLVDHMSGRHRVEKMESRAKAEKPTNGKANGKVSYPPRRARLGAEDWRHLHFWLAVLEALNELGALLPGVAKEVTTEVKPKLAEHKVANLDRVGSTLQTIRSRLGWVDVVGGDPARWYLTSEYQRLSPEERQAALSRWDDQGNPVSTVDLAEARVTPEEVQDHPVVLSSGNHRFELPGTAFGLPRVRALVEVDLPPDPSAEERLAFLMYILNVREELLKLV